MPEYRRVRIPGSTIFITVVTYHRTPLFLDSDARDIFRFAWKDASRKFPFKTDAICLLPDHIHALITLPEDDDDYPLRIHEIKRVFTKRYLIDHKEMYKRSQSYQTKKEATVWQRRYWEHTIIDNKDYQYHFDYIHYNPVKHGLVESVISWPWSSFQRYIRLGIYNENWGSGSEPDNHNINFGE
jgi:putative transposase